MGSWSIPSQSPSSSVGAHAQLKALLATIDAGVGRAPHNIPLKALRAEVLSASSRGSEARTICEKELKAAATAPGGGSEAATQSALWLYTLGRVLYDSSLLPEATEKLADEVPDELKEKLADPKKTLRGFFGGKGGDGPR